MKKVLFATTALVATAGIAAAEVTMSGQARFGLTYNDGNEGDDTVLDQRFRLTFTGITESDNGVKFEARVRIETNEDGDGSTVSPNDIAPAGIAVSTGGFRLDVGNVSDVLDSGDVFSLYGSGIGYTAFIEQNALDGVSVGGFGNGTSRASTIKIKYSVGDFTVSASYTDDSENSMIGAGYSFGNYNVGLVVGEDRSSNDFVAIGFGGEIDAFSFDAILIDTDGRSDVGFGFSVNYDISAMTSVQFAYAMGDSGQDDSYGIGFKHGLGGGVSLGGGIGSSGGDTVADLGVVFNF